MTTEAYLNRTLRVRPRVTRQSAQAGNRGKAERKQDGDEGKEWPPRLETRHERVPSCRATTPKVRLW